MNRDFWLFTIDLLKKDTYVANELLRFVCDLTISTDGEGRRCLADDVDSDGVVQNGVDRRCTGKGEAIEVDSGSRGKRQVADRELEPLREARVPHVEESGDEAFRSPSADDRERFGATFLPVAGQERNDAEAMIGVEVGEANGLEAGVESGFPEPFGNLIPAIEKDRR